MDHSSSLSIDYVFKTLTGDEQFIQRIKVILAAITQDGKINQYDAPQLIYLITDAYNELSKVHVTYDQLPDLLKMLVYFTITKFDLLPPETTTRLDFEKLLDASIKLILIQPKVKSNITLCLDRLRCSKK